VIRNVRGIAPGGLGYNLPRAKRKIGGRTEGKERKERITGKRFEQEGQ